MRRFSFFLLSIVCLTFAACTNSSTPQGPALVYVCQLSYPDLLLRLSGQSPDSAFRRALVVAQQAYDSDSHRGFLPLFQESYERVAPQGHLADIFATAPQMEGKVTIQATNKEVIAKLQEAAQGALGRSAELIKGRYVPKEKPGGLAYLYAYLKKDTDLLDETSLTTRVLRDRDAIEVAVRGRVDPGRIRRLILTRGELGFWETYENAEIYPYLVSADKTLEAMVNKGQIPYTRPQAEVTSDQSAFFDGAVVGGDSTKQRIAESKKRPVAQDTISNPLFRLLNPIADQEGMLTPGAAVGMALGKDTALINNYLGLARIQAGLPRDLRLMWGARSINDERPVYLLYAIRINPVHPGPDLGGDMITDARGGYDMTGQPDVTLTMSQAGSDMWFAMTAKAAQGGGGAAKRSVAITIDGLVFSAPRVMNAIKGGATEISGIYTVNEATDMANILKYGNLPAPLVLVEERIDPAPADGHK